MGVVGPQRGQAQCGRGILEASEGWWVRGLITASPSRWSLGSVKQHGLVSMGLGNFIQSLSHVEPLH